MHAFIEIEDLVGKQFKKYKELEHPDNIEVRKIIK